ncbi:hypothetical protein EON65_27110 [archaeon]|nr:MAG: hypothetical protein EON65_27110 [archaeon]
MFTHDAVKQNEQDETSQDKWDEEKAIKMKTNAIEIELKRSRAATGMTFFGWFAFNSELL